MPYFFDGKEENQRVSNASGGISPEPKVGFSEIRVIRYLLARSNSFAAFLEEKSIRGLIMFLGNAKGAGTLSQIRWALASMDQS
jgi:hypothetical protein